MKDCTSCIYFLPHTDYPEQDGKDWPAGGAEWESYQTWRPSAYKTGCIHGGNCHGAKHRKKKGEDE